MVKAMEGVKAVINQSFNWRFLPFLQRNEIGCYDARLS